MTQSQQQSERKFIAVDFRGIRQLSRERTAIEIHGIAGIDVVATLGGPLPVPDDVEPDASPWPPVAALGAVTIGLGGEAVRAAYAYAGLGGLVAFAGTAGTDTAGNTVVRWLSGVGVDVSRITRAGATPVRVLLAPAGQVALSIGGGAAATQPPEMVVPAAPVEVPPRENGVAQRSPEAPARHPRTVLIAGYPFVGALRGAPTRDLLRDARARGWATALSLSPVQLGGDGPALNPDDLTELLPVTELLCGGPRELRRATRRSDPQEAARALLDAGVRAVLARRGPEGAIIFRLGSSGMAREDTPTPTVASNVASLPPLRLASAFGAVYDAAFLLGQAVNDNSPIRFAAAVAARAASSPAGVLGLVPHR